MVERKASDSTAQQAPIALSCSQASSSVGWSSTNKSRPSVPPSSPFSWQGKKKQQIVKVFKAKVKWIRTGKLKLDDAIEQAFVSVDDSTANVHYTYRRNGGLVTP